MSRHQSAGHKVTCLQVRELSSSLATAQQQLAGAQSAQAADAAAAEQRLKLLQQQLTTAEAGLMRRMTGGWLARFVLPKLPKQNGSAC
jgi:hypothetical protein